jgi:hypothetical protein
LHHLSYYYLYRRFNVPVIVLYFVLHPPSHPPMTAVVEEEVFFYSTHPLVISAGQPDEKALF